LNISLKKPCAYHAVAFNIPWIYNLVIDNFPCGISVIHTYVWICIIKNVVYYTFHISWRYIPYYIPFIYHLIDLEHTYHYTSNIPFIYHSVCLYSNKPLTFFQVRVQTFTNERSFGFKIQDSRSRKKFLNPILESSLGIWSALEYSSVILADVAERCRYWGYWGVLGGTRRY